MYIFPSGIHYLFSCMYGAIVSTPTNVESSQKQLRSATVSGGPTSHSKQHTAYRTPSATLETTGALNNYESERHRIPKSYEGGGSPAAEVEKLTGPGGQSGIQYATPAAPDSRNKCLQIPTVQVLVRRRS